MSVGNGGGMEAEDGPQARTAQLESGGERKSRSVQGPKAKVEEASSSILGIDS